MLSPPRTGPRDAATASARRAARHLSTRTVARRSPATRLTRTTGQRRTGAVFRHPPGPLDGQKLWIRGDVSQAPMDLRVSVWAHPPHDRLDFLPEGITQSGCYEILDLDLVALACGRRAWRRSSRGLPSTGFKNRSDETHGRPQARKICALRSRSRPPIADLFFRMIDRRVPQAAHTVRLEILGHVASKRA